MSTDDLVFMEVALRLADGAAAIGEVPIGALIVKDGKILASGINLKERHQDPCAHAEIVAIRNAAHASASWRLDGATLYVTLEPCIMCAGAVVQSRIDRVVYAAPDPKAGALGSVFSVQNETKLNHRFMVEGDVLVERSREKLKNFFASRR